MRRIRLLCTAVLFSLCLSVSAQRGELASTPPMGWNSWDAYGFTIDEADFRANVQVLAGLKQYGWRYAVIDEGWYMQNPFATTTADQKYLYDGNGLLLPVQKRFPSSAHDAGFKPLAEWVHRRGLKFGIHILRGIPKEVVEKNLPIAGSQFHAQDAADKQATCPWNDANYGVSDTAAGQAYYDSMLKRFADWGVDFIKVDCISDHPYRPTEIRQIAGAIRKTGRPIVLSLSPGPTSLSHAAEVARYAQMWRITDDHWDNWAFKDKHAEFPFGLREEFDRIASWNRYVKPGTWPDPDMLPEGELGPHPGLGQARHSRYTADEERTEFALWSISRSPLIYGGNLQKLGETERALMSNKELLSVNQTAFESYPVADLPAGFEDARVWVARTGEASHPQVYVAFFNLDDQKRTLKGEWKQLHLRDQAYALMNLWDGAVIPAAKRFQVDLPSHGSVVYRLQ